MSERVYLFVAAKGGHLGSHCRCGESVRHAVGLHRARMGHVRRCLCRDWCVCSASWCRSG